MISNIRQTFDDDTAPTGQFGARISLGKRMSRGDPFEAEYQSALDFGIDLVGQGGYKVSHVR